MHQQEVLVGAMLLCSSWTSRINRSSLVLWQGLDPISGVFRLFGRSVYRFLVPKKHFSSFLLSVVFPRKIHWISDHWFPSASSYFETAWETKMQTEEQNNETKRRRSRGRNCLRKSFHSFKYEVTDHANTRLSFLIFFYEPALIH